jgi:PIN domain nuclease of toxin-antitoxin system
MNEVVFDASAMLALIQHERGAQSKLVKKSNDPNKSWATALSTVTTVEPYTREQARIAGDLIATTEKYGLSLGDRSCLALAITLKAPVYTTEQLWRNLKVGIPIHVIR